MTIKGIFAVLAMTTGIAAPAFAENDWQYDDDRRVVHLTGLSTADVLLLESIARMNGWAWDEDVRSAPRYRVVCDDDDDDGCIRRGDDDWDDDDDGDDD